MFGEVQVYWNITPAVASEFEKSSGTVTMTDGQSSANITLKVFMEREINVFKTVTLECFLNDAIFL